jgi:putative NIF3 family GTP cyclohydrolase 1 type 2
LGWNLTASCDIERFGEKMKAIELITYLHSLDQGWMDFNTSVDTFKAGDPNAEIKGIAVAWQSYTWALEKAVHLGCNVIISHEPTFYNHFDKHEDKYYTQLPGFGEKKQFIEDKSLIIIRCHDLWDQMPEIGITDSWAKLLGLSNAVIRDGYYQVYEIPETSVNHFAKQMAASIKPLGQDGVEVIGPLDKLVRRVGIGTGAIAGLYEFVSKYHVDLAVCTDDAFSYWRDGEYAIDQQIPVIVANHAVSEEIGIQNLARHLKKEFPMIPVHHIPQGCPYKLVTRFSKYEKSRHTG